MCQVHQGPSSEKLVWTLVGFGKHVEPNFKPVHFRYQNRGDMKIVKLAVIVVCSMVVLCTGCKDNQGPAEQVGEKIDSVTTKAGESMKKAGDEMEDVVDEMEDVVK